MEKETFVLRGQKTNEVRRKEDGEREREMKRERERDEERERERER